ncbi:MAG TPA: LysE family translocator [Xanthobacteraceae bacterium]|jgi:threonine/homoserine/homoserine lactone efflux protein|nr:LysE family translocator [Xanthobacteraceae bacterium]
MSFLPSHNVLAAFTLASFVLIFTLGPDMTLFIGQTLQGGRARGFLAMLGAVTGILIHSLVAALGLSALLAASAAAFTLLKTAAALYLVWLAVNAIRHGSAFTLDRKPASSHSLVQVYLMGLGVNLLNPKIIMFFLTFLPQFVSTSDPAAGSKLFFLGLYFIALAIPTCAGMILLAEQFTARIRRAPRFMRIIDWIFAGLMGAFALRILIWRD